MACIVVILVMIFLSSLVHIIPGDPARLALGPRATEEMIERAREEMGLDEPIVLQVAGFIRGAVAGDFGRDFTRRVPVSDLVSAALPHTLILATTSLFLAVAIGIPLGIYAAMHQGKLGDRLTALGSISLVTIPPYVAGLFLLIVFSVQLRIFPAIGAGSFSDPIGYARHLVLPSVALAVTWIGYISRLVRTNMLDVLGSDYFRTGRASGLHPVKLRYQYALKNAVIPTVAILGVAMGQLIGGAIFVEVIFSRPGLGRLVFDAISSRNFPVVQAGVLVIAVLFVLANLLADLSYRFLDPRLRSGEAST